MTTKIVSVKYVVDEENLYNSPEQSRVQVQLVYN